MGGAVEQRVAVGAGVAVAVALAVGSFTVLSGSPPEVAGLETPAAEFSAARAMEHVRALAVRPAPIGAEAHAAVQRYLVERLTGLGLEPEVSHGQVSVMALGRIAGGTVENVTARLRGTNPGPSVMLSAHYDCAPNSRGAADDLSGVATLLETARALSSGAALKNDVLFVFSDGEEDGLLGARWFVETHPAPRDVAVVLNFEARGDRGQSAMYETSDDNGRLIAALAEAAPFPTSTSLLSSLSKFLPNDSDLTVYREAGIAGYGFAFADGLEHYHRLIDDADSLDPRSLQHHGSYAVALSRQLGGADLANLRAPNVVYFDLFGRVLVHYSAWLARALAVLLPLGFGLTLRRARRRGLVRPGAVGRGARVFAAHLASATLAVGVLSLGVSALVRPELRVAHARTFVGVYLAVALLAGLLVHARALRRLSGWEVTLGTLAVWTGFAAVTGLAAPGASYLFQWPLAAMGVGLWIAMRRAEPGRAVALSPWAMGVAALPAVVLFSTVTQTFFILVGTQTPVAFVVPFAIGLGAVLPWSTAALGRYAPAVFVLLALVTLGLTGWGVARAVPTADQPSNSELFYATDSATHEAFWVGPPGDLDPWQTEVLGRAPLRAGLPKFWPVETSRAFVRASHIAVAAPRVTLAASTVEAGKRTLTFEIASEARCLTMWEETRASVRATRLDGRPVAPWVRFTSEIDRGLWSAVTGEKLYDGWSASFCALERGKLTVEVTVDPAKPFDLRVVGVWDGLPTSLHLAPRPVTSIPSPASDKTLVSTRLQVAPATGQ